MRLELFVYFCCSYQNNFIKFERFESSDSENSFWKLLDSSGLIFLLSLPKAFLTADICSSNCLHCNLFCCKVNYILSGNVNFAGAFKWTGFVKESFLKLTSVLYLMFSLCKFYRYFLVITIKKCNSLIWNIHLETRVDLKQWFYDKYD